MSAYLRSLNFLHWPIWVKLTIGLMTAVIVPLVLLIVVGWNSISEVNLQNTQAYLREIGLRQEEILSRRFDEALSILNDFLFNSSYRRPILSLLRSDETSVDITSQNDTVSSLLRTGLLKVSSGLYESAWLLDPAGRVVAISQEEVTDDRTPLALGADESASIPYQLGLSMDLIQRTQDIGVYKRNGLIVIEVITLIRVGGQLVGFLVASVDFPNVIYANLDFESDLPVYSFLIDRDGDVITSPLTGLITGNAYNSDIVDAALERDSGTDIYATGSREVIGYYTPLTIQGEVDPLFALVTEIEKTAVAARVSDYVQRVSFPLVVGTAALLAVLALLGNQIFAPPLAQLIIAIRAMGSGNFTHPLPTAERGDEFGKLGTAFVDMRQQVRNMVEDLQARMMARVRDVQTTQEISRFAAAQRDLQTLLDNVVDLTVERFPDIYHAQIFLLDNDGKNAVLRASTGSVGKQLLERGHRLPVGGVSVIGRVTQEGQVVVTRDTATSQIHRRNEFLPETRAELAIPLLVGRAIIGALDVQSKQSGSFNEDEVGVLQTMAAQIAIAIQNARLYQENLSRQEEIETGNRLATLRAWTQYMSEQRIQELSTVAGLDTGIDMSDLRREALGSGQPVVGKLTGRQTVPIAVPIILRGQPLGAVEWEVPVSEFNANKVQLAQELVNRLAVSLDNARLFQESQQATERERLVNTIAARLTQQADINEILQIAVREVGQALRSPQVSIRLNWSGDDPKNGANGHG